MREKAEKSGKLERVGALVTKAVDEWAVGEGFLAFPKQVSMDLIADIPEKVDCEVLCERRTRTLLFLKVTIKEKAAVVAAASGIWKIDGKSG